MHIDQYGRTTITESEFFTSLYQGNISNDISHVYLDHDQAIHLFNSSKFVNGDKFADLPKVPDLDGITVEQLDHDNQSNWFMPNSYLEMDIKKWIFDQCLEQNQRERVELELKYFSQYKMMDVLRYLKYLVDTMRQHNILWGVGRGSSTASYCLYLIGVHKIDCLQYEIPIEEFFKNNGEGNGS